MYISANRLPGRALLRFVPANVLALGMVSLVTDISSEMVTSVLPLYMMLVLGLNPLQLGILDGLYLAAASLARLAAGAVADRWQRLKLVAAFGYGLSAVAKLGLLAAGGSVAALGAVITADRTGKGLRTAPRDALISLSTSDSKQGQSFGVHRAMDTFGALLGPLAAFGVLAATGGAYSAVFVISFCIAAAGLVVLLLYVRDRTREPAPIARFAALKDKCLRRLCLAACLLGVVTVSDFFIYLLLQQQLSISPSLFPLLPLGTAAFYLLLAVPLGKLADAKGRMRVFLAGNLALAAAYTLLAGTRSSALILISVLLLHGLFYAATDGVLMSAAGSVLAPGVRASGMAVLQTAQALARFCSSVAFGATWTLWSPRTALLLMTGALLLVLLACFHNARNQAQ